MNTPEAGQLLLAISAFDGREVTEPTVRAWAMALHDVPLEDALTWLPSYFRTHSGLGLDKVMPATVLNGVEDLQFARRREAFHAAQVPDIAAIDAANPIGAARARRERDELARENRQIW